MKALKEVKYTLQNPKFQRIVFQKYNPLQGVKKAHKLYEEIYMNSFYAFGRKNCLKNEKNPLLFQFIRKAIKRTNNYRAISLLSTSYTILSSILLARTITYANEITGEYQCWLRRNRSTIDHIISIRQIIEKK